MELFVMVHLQKGVGFMYLIYRLLKNLEQNLKLNF
jgi:hypothetical protein